jgi:nitronate monooxygenase
MFSLNALTVPIIAAPMASGPSTPELVVTAAEAGGTGFLAAGYKTAAGVAEEIARVRRATSAPFGVNLFVPAGSASQDVDRARDVEAYRRALRPEADRYQCTMPEPDAADRDGWEEKIALLLEDPVPIVSFTFGCPDRSTIEQLQRAGSYTVVSVTDAAEAALAADRGADALCVQGPKAGGHRATHELAQAPGATGLEILLREVRGVCDLPSIAAGGITRGEHVVTAMEAGAKAVQVGTVLLRSPESGASTLQKDALASDQFTGTMVTRAFSGRFARGLVNRFMRDYHDVAPAAYPEVNQLTRPLRAAAAVVGDPDGMALWAGTGYRDAPVAPAAEIITSLWNEALAERPH